MDVIKVEIFNDDSWIIKKKDSKKIKQNNERRID